MGNGPRYTILLSASIVGFGTGGVDGPSDRGAILLIASIVGLGTGCVDGPNDRDQKKGTLRGRGPVTAKPTVTTAADASGITISLKPPRSGRPLPPK
jgi:hypothetical protein